MEPILMLRVIATGCKHDPRSVRAFSPPYLPVIQ